MPDKHAYHVQERLFRLTLEELGRIGYRSTLLKTDYHFPDYFSANILERKINAAAFGQEPPSYQTACFGVFLSNGKESRNAPSIYRALGAPFQFEIKADRVVLWIVGVSNANTRALGEYKSREDLKRLFDQHTGEWEPEEVLRAKNIGFAQKGPRQLDFYDLGLIPAYEDQIRNKLDATLRVCLAITVEAYRETTGNQPDDRDMFRLVFRLLAGKVFHDRNINGFAKFDSASNPDDILGAVALHYGEPWPKVLNHQTRDAAFHAIWSSLDFRNISVDVLAQIWTHTLVTQEVRTKYGIHITPRTIAKYIVDRLPFEDFAKNNAGDRIIVEPCCGPATFLMAAMQRLRDLRSDLPTKQRHAFFRDILVGFEQGTFGVEIAKLCLTISDFPESDGWNVFERNIYNSQEFSQSLARAGIVLCNPPFEDLSVTNPHRADVVSVHQPVEILQRVLNGISPQCVLGFVMPRKFLDGDNYREMRTKIVDRFKTLEMVSLPDTAFRESESGHETVLLLATEPRHSGNSSIVRHRRVSKTDWHRFCQLHQPTRDDVCSKSKEEASISLAIPELAEIWSNLTGLKTLGELATISRGIEWIKNAKERVLDEPQEWTRKGVPPHAKINDFQTPGTAYLNMRPEDQRRNAYLERWDKPKVILNASRRSRGPWRISAFADFSGLACYRAFLAIWPHDPHLTTLIAAILNSPVANAWAATREGPNIGQDFLMSLCVPEFSPRQRVEIEDIVSTYLKHVTVSDWHGADSTLRLMDAIILQAYDLPPRIERKLLDYFCGATRTVPFAFGDYFPESFAPCLPLAEYLSADYSISTAKAFRERRPPPPKSVLDALRAAVHDEG